MKRPKITFDFPALMGAAGFAMFVIGLVMMLASCSPRVIRVDSYDYVKVSNGWDRGYIRKDQLPLWNAGIAVMFYQTYKVRMPKIDQRTAGR